MTTSSSNPKRWQLGTSSLVVAAFVGPGTVLTCASAGARFGYGLGWVLLFATAAAFVLQSFTAGTGTLARKGLGEAIRETVAARERRGVAFGLVYGLVVLGLWVGCAAFEMGNLLGAAAGLEVVLGLDGGGRWLMGLLALGAGLVLLQDLRFITAVFQGLVALMGVLFLATLFVAPVDWSAALRGLFVPSLPDESALTVIALVGTTIVTYNLFLHPSAAKVYWQDEAPERAWRRELAGMALFLPLGGLISFAILASGATLGGAEATGVADFALLLEPVAGPAARLLFGLGLFAAGLTSAVTAPLAAASGIREIFGWPEGTRDRRYRLVWASVLLTGLFFGLSGFSPLPAIVAAQAANGLLLPLIAAFVLYLTYQQREVPLPRWYFALGALVVLVCAGLGLRTLWWVWERLG